MDPQEQAIQAVPAVQANRLLQRRGLQGMQPLLIAGNLPNNNQHVRQQPPPLGDLSDQEARNILIGGFFQNNR